MPKSFNRVGLILIRYFMKQLSIERMEKIEGGLTNRHWGCALKGLAAGIASGMNPIVGGIVTTACFLLTD